MPVKPRAHLAALRPVVHGSISAAEARALGRQPAEILDFSVSTNPLGPSPAAVAALGRIDPARYPDDQATALLEELARRERLPVERLLAGNGSSEIIWLAAQAYLDPGDRAMIAGPTYGEYARAVRQAAAEPVEWRASPRDNFAIDSAALLDLARTIQPRILFLGNPNNPTGRWIGNDELVGLAAALPDTLIAIDEAYRPFVVHSEPTGHLSEYPNVLLIRSLTKDGGLAGLRLGYALAQPEIIAALAALRPPWSVNAAAQAAGLAALQDRAHWERSRGAVRAGKAYLEQALRELGYPVVPSDANFLLVRVGDGAAFRQRLLASGICVRDCASFGLPEYIRLGVRPLDECRHLITALTGLAVAPAR